jgi:hypothetical protein
MKMNKTIVRLTLCTIIVIHLGNQLYAQQPPDSLIRKVVVFKRPANGQDVDSVVKEYYRGAKLPQATGFYIKPDSPGILFCSYSKT